MNSIFNFDYKIPIICTAIHNGHDLDLDFKDNIGISEADQLREEDPFTEYFTEITGNRIINYTSRFQVDVNRKRSKAVYLKPNDAWGLSVRKKSPSKEMIEKSLKDYDTFYRRTEIFFKEMEKSFGTFFVYDIHSYNHRRNGPEADFDPIEENPEINLGTSNIPPKWTNLISVLGNDLSEFSINGRSFDTRFDVKFPGGPFARWVHNTFPETGCCISIEFKKIFMDEWTGKPDLEIMKQLKSALASTIPNIIKNLKEVL